MTVNKIVLEQMHASGLFKAEDRILAAVSGGSDSIVMAFLLKQAACLTGIAHCNFGLRPEADQEQKLVETTATQWGIPFWTRFLDAKAYATQHKVSIQVAARELRYAWFKELYQKGDFEHIALAHHADDQVESIIMNLLRSKNNRVLMGIPPSNPPFIRPLLKINKAQLLLVAEENKLAFMVDSSNFSTKYLRNLIRIEVLPVLEKVNPSWLNHLQEREKTYSKQIDLLIEQGNEIKSRRENGNEIIYELKGIEKEKLEVYLPIWLEMDGFTPGQAAEAMRLVSAPVGRKMTLAGREILKDRDRLLIRKQKEKEVFETLTLARNEIVDKQWKIKGKGLRFEWVENVQQEEYKIQKGFFLLDPDKVKWPLHIRSWQAGDRMQPLGMKGKKKLKEIFTDLKRTRFEKKETLVFQDQKQIILLSGYRIAEGVKVDQKSKQGLIIYLKSL